MSKSNNNNLKKMFINTFNKEKTTIMIFKVIKNTFFKNLNAFI